MRPSRRAKRWPAWASNGPWGKRFERALTVWSHCVRKSQAMRDDCVDVAGILGAAATDSVPISEIDADNRTYAVRAAIDKAFHDDDVTINRGTFDGTAEHPIVVLSVARRFVPVSGHRRLAVLRALPDVRRIRCLVLPDGSEYDATIIAARANLSHGQPLTPTEKRTAFYAEYDARRARGGRLPTMRELARVYRVAPATPANWLAMRCGGDGADDAAAGRRGRRVQIEQRAADRVATPDHAEAGSLLPADGGGSRAGDNRSNAPAHPAPTRPQSAGAYPCGAAEAVECLKTSIEMLEAVPREELASQVEALHGALGRLRRVLDGVASSQNKVA